MSDDREDPPEDRVGYRRPPRSGQFRKGQSGNPRGRPRKRDKEPEFIAARFPTSEALRAEAVRLIKVNDASGQHTITTTQAVLRALAHAAMRGGVLAQRTYLEHQRAEDERHHRERKALFELWENYKEVIGEKFAAAQKAGRPAPEMLPHPDDIELDYRRLEVRFLGAIDEMTREAEKQAEAFYSLGFEMAVYVGEDNLLPPRKGEEGRIGFYMTLHLLGHEHLPPRLRVPLETLEAEIMQRAAQGMKSWGDDLERRCAEGRVPFVRPGRNLRPPTWPMSRIGVRWSPRMALHEAAARPQRRS